MANIKFPQLKYMKPEEITDKEKERIKGVIETYCPGLFQITISNDKNGNKKDTTNVAKQNESIIYVIAFAKKYNMSLLTYFVDVYHRTLLDYWIDTHGETLLAKDFTANYKFMKELKQMSSNTDKEINDLWTIFHHLIPTFHARVFRFPEFATSLYKYQDALDDYIEITSQINNVLRGIAKSNKYETSDTDQPYPSQLDVWIIPYDVIKDEDDGNTLSNEEEEYKDYYGDGNEEDDDDDDDDDEEEQKMNETETNQNEPALQSIGNIEKKLKLNKQKHIICDYEHHKFPRKDTNWREIFRKILRSENKQRPLLQLQPYKRYILLIDRRKENKKKIHIYFYEAPKGSNIIYKEHHQYLQCINFFNSKKCVLPKHPTMDYDHNNADIGLFNTVDGYMFGLSYHINSADSIASYWISHGSVFRMFETDMKYVWPSYFNAVDQVKNNDNLNQKNSNNKPQPKSIRDNNKYKGKENQKIIKQSFIEFEDKPFQQFYEETTGKKNLYQRNNPDIDNQDDVLYKLKLLIPGWSKEVTLTITYIQDEYDANPDLSDIIEDIEDGVENSGILTHLVEQDIDTKRVIDFGKLMMKMLTLK